MDDKLEARLARIEAALARIEQLTHGARATYVGAGRVLTRATFPDFHLGFLVKGDDRLLAPALIVNGVYEAEITNHFLRTVKPSDHCIDVGGNFGYYTCLMGRLAHSGRTTGIEPDPETFELLRDNIYINYLERCTTGLHGAASNADGTLTLHRRITRSGNTSIVQLNSDALRMIGEVPSEEFQAEAFRVDKLLDAMNGRVDHIKIDVEGAEPLVLEGMQRTLATNPRLRIVMEWSPGQIQGAGFDLNTFVDQMRTAKLKPSAIGPTGPTAVSFDDLVASSYLTGVLLTR